MLRRHVAALLAMTLTFGGGLGVLCAAEDEALTDIALPAARDALADAGVEAAEIDLLICATVTPDMMFPTSSALLADTLGMPRAAAYDLLAGCTGFVYALAQAYGMVSSGLSRRALVVGGDVAEGCVGAGTGMQCMDFKGGIGTASRRLG